MKYIKHLIPFLLIIGLAVSEFSVYSQVNSANYYQVSYVNTKREFSHKKEKWYVYGKKILSRKISIAHISYLNLQDVYNTKIQTILKLHIEVYQTINSMITQHVFLNKIISSSNPYSSLYIA